MPCLHLSLSGERCHSVVMRLNPTLPVLCTVVLFLVACKSQTQQKTDAPPARKKSNVATCVESMVRARQCTDEFIPALVAARVRLDRPPGIVKSDAEPGRQALIETAKAEWANDSKDEAIASRCDDIAKQAPTEMVDMVNACMAEPSCATYVQCFVRAIEPTL